jgi:hypothetical protein
MYTKQRGAVSGALIAVLAFLGFLIIVGIVVASSYVSAYNYGNSMEQQLTAVQDNNRNLLAQYGQKVQESVQVPDMYKADLIELTKAAIGGRYGPDGSKAGMQWIKEQNPNLDISVYKQIQQIIEAGRNDFQNGQTRQIDLKRQYETALGSFWQGMWMHVAGYPKLNLKDFDIVSTGRADDAFKTKKEAPLQLRAK